MAGCSAHCVLPCVRACACACVCVCVCVCYFYYPLRGMGSSVFVAFPCHIPFCTVNSEILRVIYFMKMKPLEMEKSPCRLLMLVIMHQL